MTRRSALKLAVGGVALLATGAPVLQPPQRVISIFGPFPMNRSVFAWACSVKDAQVRLTYLRPAGTKPRTVELDLLDHAMKEHAVVVLVAEDGTTLVVKNRYGSTGFLTFTPSPGAVPVGV